VTFLWIAIAAAFASLAVYGYMGNKSRDRQLAEMEDKLSRIRRRNSSEPLLLVTRDRHLQSLLTEINRVLDDNRSGRAQYAKKEQSMKKMLANMSHDLKTPLTVVLGYMEIIRTDPALSEEERARLLGCVYEKTMEIVKLMNALFQLAKLESGDKEVAVKHVHISEVCRKNIVLYYDLAVAKGFEVAIDVPDEPVYALAGEEELDRVLVNLLSNAFQYGGDGKTIGLSLTYDDTSVTIEVWDRGKGIREVEQELVFERMFTLEESRNKTFHGSGLGLTIAKRLVEQMGGTLTLQSRPYERTSFIVRLKRMKEAKT